MEIDLTEEEAQLLIGVIDLEIYSIQKYEEEERGEEADTLEDIREKLRD